ncbi:MAG: deoxyribodipyrimidine photo-lyase [Candidatus Magasanikbacteria bacterium]
MAKYKKSIFIFRRGLRRKDNTGLISALKNSNQVLPCFIFSPKQLENNEYKSNNAVQFMIESLKDLNDQLKQQKGGLYKFYGTQPNIISKLLKKHDFDAVFTNRDYTPFSRKRDKKIKKECKKRDVDFIQKNDYLLIEPEDIETNESNPYKVFTPFYKKAKKKRIDKPETNQHTNYFTGDIDISKSKKIYNKILASKNDKIFKKGGRKEAMKIIRNLHNYDEYDKQRELPARDGTTGLSAHNKFGTISIRELYWDIRDQLNKEHTLIQELFWRDFFTHIAFHFPKVFGEPFYEKYKQFNWSYSKKKFKAWKKGETGFPIVDAGMRQLNTTGWMHNRVRMIVASFLTKDLRIDWRWGEKYFASKLVDYDPAVNNGNWQWAASTGCDSQPYFRIFNPWTQQEDYDQKAEYIKKWIPELKDIEPSKIHQLNETTQPIKDIQYPEPIVDHDTQRKKTLEKFKQLN